MHLAYRWFTGLGFDQDVPHHSTFSKNRHGRFQESPLFLELFERIVQQCMNVGLLKGVDLSFDRTQIRADVSPDRTITREQLPEVAKVNRTVREYVELVSMTEPFPETVAAKSGLMQSDHLAEESFSTASTVCARFWRSERIWLSHREFSRPLKAANWRDWRYVVGRKT